MPRLGQRDNAKERYWRKVFADWEISALSGAEYCRQHNIKYTQFNDWRKVFARRHAEVEARTAELQREHRKRLAARRASSDTPEEMAKTGRTTRRQAMASRARAIAENAKHGLLAGQAVEFAEVQLIDNPTQALRLDPTATGEQPCLEIVFRNGVRVRVHAGCSPELLSSVASLLEDR